MEEMRNLSPNRRAIRNFRLCLTENRVPPLGVSVDGHDVGVVGRDDEQGLVQLGSQFLHRRVQGLLHGESVLQRPLRLSVVEGVVDPRSFHLEADRR